MLKPILEVTYGCMVYQEQVMQIVRDLAGYSMGRSDLVRRAMAKKKHDVMAKEKEIFIHGKVEPDGKIVRARRGAQRRFRGGRRTSIFEEMTAFASYAFNKSHAAAYAVVAVQTGVAEAATIPRNSWPPPMNSVAGNSEKVAFYIQYLPEKGHPRAAAGREFFAGEVLRGPRFLRREGASASVLRG